MPSFSSACSSPSASSSSRPCSPSSSRPRRATRQTTGGIASSSSSHSAGNSVPSAAAAPFVSSSPMDAFYGHEEIARSAGRFITALFACPNIPTASNGGPTPSLPHFIAYALHRTRLPEPVTIAALLLLSRLKARFPAARGSSGHRLFISAFMMASKVLCDDTYSNKSWAIVAQGMFALKEVNQMEREMLSYLEWNINVTTSELNSLRQTLLTSYGPPPVPAVLPPTPITPSLYSAPHPAHAHSLPTQVQATAYPSPPCSPIAIPPSPAYLAPASSSEHSPSSSASPASSIGSVCTTPPNGVSSTYRGVESADSSVSGKIPIVSAVGHDDRDEVMQEWVL